MGTSTKTKTGVLALKGDANAIQEAVAVAASVAPAKSARPVLQNLLLETVGGKLSVTGSDMDVTVRTTAEQVEILSEGRILLNAARVNQILRELGNESLELQADERHGCKITAPEARFKILGEDAADYPALDEEGAWTPFTLKGGDLLGMVTRTWFATHPEKTRYAMNGVLVEIEGSRLSLVATDGKRLSLCERAVDVPDKVRVVVPTKGMSLLLKLLNAEAEVEFALDDKKKRAMFTSGGFMIHARLLVGNFPPYREVLPKGGNLTASVDKTAFGSALRRAALLATKDSQAVRFKFTKAGLDLTARVPEVGDTHVSLPLDFPHDDLEVGFNPAYFADVLKVLKGEKLVIELKDKNSAAVIRETVDGTDFTYLVMPLNLG